MKRVNLQLASPPRTLIPYAPQAELRTLVRGLSPMLSLILEEVQRELGLLRKDQSFTTIGNREVEELVQKIALRVGFELSSYERDEVLAYIERDEKPFGILQPLVDDPAISDIIISNFSSISMQQGKRNFSTEISFPHQEAYEAYVERLLQRAGTTYSTKKPIADGMIGAFARVHAVHKSICDTGPYVTIRLNRFARVTLNELLEIGLSPAPMIHYLQSLVQNGNTILLAGEVGTGKTTLARALASSIPNHEAILVIEDTPEIRLEHPHVRYITTRETNTDGEGRVSPHECIRAGMRMAMNRIIFGEIRDPEASEAFIDVCASGHSGLSTIHARSATEAIARLELLLGRAQRGANHSVILEQIATAVQLIVFLDICHVTGKRRVMEVKEIGPVADGVLRQRDMFRYDCRQHQPTWNVLGRVSAHKKALESGSSPLYLSNLGSTLELTPEILLKEVTQ